MHEFDTAAIQDLDASSKLEWMLADGFGGYAMGTVCDLPTRRYHGLLVCTRPGTLDRILVLAAIEAFVEIGGKPYPLSSNQYAGAIYPEGFRSIRTFRFGEGQAEWSFAVEGALLTKRIEFVAGGSKLRITWSNVGKKSVVLKLRPLTAFRSYHGNFVETDGYPQDLALGADSTWIGHDGMVLTLGHPGAHRAPIEGWYYRFEHLRESERRLDPRDDLYCPCELTFELGPKEWRSLDASVQPAAGKIRDRLDCSSRSSELAEASQKFMVDVGEESTVIAGYPWFADWGRDTMISLPGLCLGIGDFGVGRQILRSYAARIDQGMIPNRVLESGEREFNSVDATLWFVDALYKVLVADWDAEFAAEMFEALLEIHGWHMRGTRFRIAVDPKDGMIDQGDDGVQLTWMDAKVGDWVVTPRRGKPIEVAALWINAMRAAEWIGHRLDLSGERFRLAAERAEAHFEAKFWRKNLGYYLDTADPDDASLRPNQVIAMGLPFSPCDRSHAALALEKVESNLATPFGLRTLSPSDAHYIGRFEGSLQQLDAAYHQGTVWPWLLGSYALAIDRYVGDRERAVASLAHAESMMAAYGLGGIAEVYDGDPPHRPNGCPWQAWSIAEIFRARVALGAEPKL